MKIKNIIIFILIIQMKKKMKLYKKNEKVVMIKIRIEYQVTLFKDLFYYCECVSSIFFKKFL